MITITHSVAPWRVEPAKGTLCAWRIESSGTNNAVAFVAQTIGNNQIENANAKLISAAPELLEACKAALCNFTHCNKQNSLDGWEERTLDILRQAIAKAEGNA